MIYLNFTNLDEETQQVLLGMAREHVESESKVAIEKYCKENGGDYERIIDEESIKKLYTYDYVFNI
ncbi:hypothetical protein MTsPCn9_25710 [Croceitalea sp. MTPC9]|uniref:hypothetical protein n=1 Tax=unclassified Croceitalea TaxID=2632280 RepID=UPI002B3B99C5|nr:hypothetical protein MTsPCn6_28820 [Croceitalea sp. MTPC6]GMN17633.1 hypothetical protein MTsPCn9_25710 [Croceitalea sp. MTPC9]